MSISLQRCHCQTFALISVYQPRHLPDFIALFSVYNCATCQTLWHWFQFTAVPLVRLYFIWFQFAVLPFVRLYFIGFSFQSCHLPDLIYSGSVYSSEIYNWESYHVVCLCPLGPWPNAHYVAALLSARIYFTRSKVWPDWPEYTSPGSRCDLIGQNILHQVQGVTWSARIYFTRSKVWPDWPEYTSLGPRCDLLIAIPNILLNSYKGTHQSD